MQFHDKRRDPTQPLSETLCRLLGVVVLNEKSRDSEYSLADKRDLVGLHISFCDHDPLLGAWEHLALNFEPKWLNDDFRNAYQRQTGKSIGSKLLENTEWKRYAWGIWEE